MKKATILTLILLLILALAVPALAELRRGSKGADVVELQKRLIELGYLTGDADGSFGPMTEAALEGFQALNGLDVTGVATIKDTTILFSDNAVDLYGHSVSGQSAPAPADTLAPTDTPAPTPTPAPAGMADSVSIIASDTDVQIVEAGWDVSYGFLYYAIRLHNDSETNAIQFPAFRITARDASGGLMGTEDQMLDVIRPGQDYVWAGLGMQMDGTPAKVEFEVLQPDSYNIVSPASLEHPDYQPPVAESVNKNGERILGEVFNPNDYDIRSAAVVVIFRDDKGTLQAGDVTFVDNVRAGGKTPFDFSYLNPSLATEHYEVYVNAWM